MTFTVKTIPDMLVEAYGNQTEVARILNCNRATVRKYIGDKEGKDTLSSTVFLWFTADGVKILMRDIRQVLERWGHGRQITMRMLHGRPLLPDLRG